MAIRRVKRYYHGNPPMTGYDENPCGDGGCKPFTVEYNDGKPEETVERQQYGFAYKESLDPLADGARIFKYRKPDSIPVILRWSEPKKEPTLKEAAKQAVDRWFLGNGDKQVSFYDAMNAMRLALAREEAKEGK